MFSFLSPNKELLITYDIRKYGEAIQALKDHGIKFFTKSAYVGSRGWRGSVLGTAGENEQYQTEYKIFVKKQDYEQALFVINSK